MTTKTNDNIIEFPVWKLHDVEAKLRKLQKSCKKLSLSIPELKKLRQYELKREHVNEITHEKTTYIIDMLEIEILNMPKQIKLPQNFTVIGVIDHKENLVHNIHDQVIPQKFYNRVTCDHCKHNRERNKTIIVQNTKTLEFKQVGTKCLLEYIGVDGIHILNLTANYRAMLSENNSDDFIVHSVRSFNLNRVLGLCIDHISKHGYISVSRADLTYTMSTSAIIKEKVNENEKSTEQSKNKAKQIITYLKKNLKETNDYTHNILSIIENDYCTFKTIGFVASIYGLYNRMIEETKTQNTSNHIGTIKEKITLTVKHLNTSNFESQYGLTFFHKFIDSNDNIIVWKSSNKPDFIKDMMQAPNQTITIKATIKSHTDYKGIKQTNILRVKPV